MGIFTKAKKDFLHIEMDEDYYFAVKLKNAVICYTTSKEDAEEVKTRLNPKYKWNKVKNLNELAAKEPVLYEENIKPILIKFGVPKKMNGNYLITQDSNGNVDYRLSDSEVVRGSHLTNGLAIRYKDGAYHLDNVFIGQAIISMNSDVSLRKFYKETKTYIPYHLENVNRCISDDLAIKEYLISTKEAILSDTKLPVIDNRTLSSFQFSLLADSNEENYLIKREVFLNAMEKLNKMVGIKEVKQQVDNFVKGIFADKELKKVNVSSNKIALHSLFVGPPGTGKTETARLMGDILWSLGLLENNNVTELSKEDLVTSAIGGTEEITKAKINKAMGGILFIDEAYMLKNNDPTQSDYGKIALEIIMRAMSNHPEELMVIFAGYTNQINELLEVNSGLQSRFVYTFNFEQLTPIELSLIAKTKLEDNDYITTDIEVALNKLMTTKAKSGNLQGNARDVGKMVQSIINNHKLRITNDRDSLKNFKTIHPDDVYSLMTGQKYKEKDGLTAIKEEALAELNSLIGLDNIKKQLPVWLSYVAMEKKRQELGGITSPIRMHLTFEGDSGVGKTKVARLIGKFFYGAGMLSKGHFVEKLGKDLVAGYMGQTSEKVKGIINEAAGGVLFIDEAYSMINGSDDSFGQEAVDRLVGELDNRFDDLVVILAGYPKEIDELFASNQGFKSRIGQRFVFENYSAAQLTEIFYLTAAQNGINLTEEAKVVAANIIEKAVFEEKVEGNARWAVKLFEKAKMTQSARLYEKTNINANEYFEISAEDIEKAKYLL